MRSLRVYACRSERVALLGLALLLALPVASRAGVLHVSTRGSGRPDGSPAAPFKTVAEALKHSRPGDTVQVGAGIHVGRVVAPVSGAPGKPIVIRGERGCPS